MMTIKNYVKPQTLEEAWQLNQKRGSRILGGMLWLKMGKRRVQTAIDLSGLGLDTIEETGDSFSIGCMTSLRDLELHPGLDHYTCGAMKEALRHIVGVQFRNLATVGGSIAGRFGFSDVLTMFLALDSYVELYKGGLVPMETFASTGCGTDICVRIIIRKTPLSVVYHSVRNTATDFPVLACAASRQVSDAGDSWKFSIGARPARAVLLRDETHLLQGELTAQKADLFGAYAAEQVPVSSNMRGSAAYRSHLVKVLTSRSIQELGGISL